MKIDVLRLIKDALIGGRDGEMAYIYNNPFMFELFNQWKNSRENFHLHKNDENIAFKEFLKACLKEEPIEESKPKPQQVIGYKTLTKEYHINQSDKDYTKWKNLETEINVKRNQQRDLVQDMAKKYNETLADISIVKLQDSFQYKKIVFEFPVEAILEDKRQEKNKH